MGLFDIFEVNVDDRDQAVLELKIENRVYVDTYAQ